MQKRIITSAHIDALLEKIIHAGKQLFVPQKIGKQVDFAPMRGLVDVTHEYIQTTRSAKAVFFPPVEELLRFQREGAEFITSDRDLDKIPESVLFGVRPCDAMSIESLSTVFTRDYSDSLFVKRLEKTTVIGCSCANADDDCFCTSVGGNPGDTRGSDILLTRLSNGDHLVEILTNKGEAIISLAPELFSAAASEIKEDHLAHVPQKFDHKLLQQKLASAFDHPFWQATSSACIGCGACAYVCPVCSCFDIQDEGSRNKGSRLRSWDACGLGLFTLHTSGHNPRHLQSERWRQRMLHKFSYMPDQLQVLGCVGCGRCSRACPADMNILHQIEQIISVL